MRTGKLDSDPDSGTRLTPSVGAELIATPAALSPIHQQLHEDATGRMTRSDRRRLDLRDDRLQMLDDRRYREVLDGRRVRIQRLDLHLEAGVCRSQDAVAAARSEPSSPPSFAASPRSRG